MEKYYIIRSFEDNKPILIIKVESEDVKSVYTLDHNEIIEWNFNGNIFVNQVNQIPNLEECLVNDKKNRDRAKAKLEHIYKCVKDRLTCSKRIYYMPHQESSNIDKQIEDAIEFLKTKGLKLNEKIDLKKLEHAELENELKKIQNNNRDKASRLGILSMICVLTIMHFLSDFIDSLPFTLEVIISASVAAVPVFLTVEHELNKKKKQMEKIEQQISLAQSYLKKYKDEKEKKLTNTPTVCTYEIPDLKISTKMYRTESPLPQDCTPIFGDVEVNGRSYTLTK